MNLFPKKEEKDFEKRLTELDEIEKQIELRDKVRKREEGLGLRHSFKKPTWSKLMMLVVFGLCIEIVIFAEYAMFTRYDLSALYTLLGVPVAMFGTFWAYAEKSKVENSSGGITYETAMFNLNKENDIDIVTNDDSLGVDAPEGEEGEG